MPAATAIQSSRINRIVGAPVDTIPGKCSDGALAANGQAEMKILGTAWIDRLQGAA